MGQDAMPARKGRATAVNPPTRFDPVAVALDPGALEPDDLRQVPTTFYEDKSKTILARNDSPDVGFTWSINAYRGCEHGCIYCYARPSHEYLGWSAGLDFETKILVKRDAPALLSQTLQKSSWTPDVVALSGNTDPYQPVERRLKLTRGCLEVLLRHRNPVAVITKNHLVTRDLDLLAPLADMGLARVFVSVTTLQSDLARVMEPRTSTPDRRLEAIRKLSDAGVPTGVMVAPVVPGLTDEEMPAILQAAAECGATRAGYIMLRLPGPVAPLFVDWLERKYPERKSKVLHRIRDLRDGRLSDSRFGHRMRGEGVWARTMAELFELTCKKNGLNKSWPPLRADLFVRSPGDQMLLFDD